MKVIQYPLSQRLIAKLGVRLRPIGLDLEEPHVEESPDKNVPSIVNCEFVWVWIKSFGMSVGPISLGL